MAVVGVGDGTCTGAVGGEIFFGTALGTAGVLIIGPAEVTDRRPPGAFVKTNGGSWWSVRRLFASNQRERTYPTPQIPGRDVKPILAARLEFAMKERVVPRRDPRLQRYRLGLS